MKIPQPFETIQGRDSILYEAIERRMDTALLSYIGRITSGLPDEFAGYKVGGVLTMYESSKSVKGKNEGDFVEIDFCRQRSDQLIEAGIGATALDTHIEIIKDPKDSAAVVSLIAERHVTHEPYCSKSPAQTFNSRSYDLRGDSQNEIGLLSLAWDIRQAINLPSKS